MTRELAPIDPRAPRQMRLLAEKLRECTARSGYSSLREVAAAARRSPSTVSEALSGTHTPSWQTVKALLKVLDQQVSTGWFKLVEEAKEAERKWRQDPPPGAVPPPVPAMRSVRPPTGDLPPYVRGRDSLLDHLSEQLVKPKPGIHVLHGLGGCGKTTVALELARRGHRAGHLVFWLSAQQRDRMLGGMRVIAAELGISEEEIEDAWSGTGNAPDLVWRHLDEAGRRWLLVIDNADEPGLLSVAGGTPGDGTGWIRDSPSGMTVVTSRVGSPDVWGNAPARHLVDVLTIDPAADILMDFASRAGSREEAVALAALLGGLPLALVAAGGYLARSGRGLLRHRSGARNLHIRTFDSYIQELERIGPDFLDEARRNGADHTDLERLHRGLVGRTWEMSLDLLDAQGISASRGLMRLMSCFAPNPFPIDLIEPETIDGSGLFPGSVSLDDLGRGLEALVDVHQLNLAESGALTTAPAGFPASPLPCVAGHRLVLETTAARVRTQTRAERAAVWKAAAQVLEAATRPEPEEVPNWDWWRLMAPHIQAALERMPSDDPATTAQLLSAGLRCFAYLLFANRSRDVRNLLRVLSGKAASLPADHPARLAIRHREVLLDQELSWPEQAEIYREIFDRQLLSVGPDHPDALITNHDWANALLAFAEPELAERELRLVAERRTRVLGPANLYTLLSRRMWVHALQKLGLEDDAEAAMRRMVQDCDRERGSADHLTILYRGRLASQMVARGHESEGEAEYKSVSAVYGTGDFLRGTSLPVASRQQMARALEQDARFVEAESEYRAMFEELTANADWDSTEYRHLAMGLAANLRAQRKLEEVLEHLAGLLDRHRDLGEADPFVLALRHQYGDDLTAAGRLADAEVELSAVVALQSDDLDSVALSYRHCRAHVLGRLHRHDEAEADLRLVSTTLTQLVGAEAPNARSSIWCHAMSLLRMNRLVDALPRLEECLAAELSVLGPESHDVLISRHRIAETRYRLDLTGLAETRSELEALVPLLIAHNCPDGSCVTAVHETLAELS
ncbi:NB-ARC domain-containing protein [Actinoplanes subglobosus]|uniref:NB-ARC domain-containing protein n=1 Tax=Actinoplanes subglobosus TaxID=1547892 RepID=A0ABV8J205_9ACTN